MTRVRWSEDDPVAPARRPLRWLPILERELRQRMGWVDEAISPFRRVRPQPVTKPATHLSRADTLLFPSGERKSA